MNMLLLIKQASRGHLKPQNSVEIRIITSTLINFATRTLPIKLNSKEMSSSDSESFRSNISKLQSMIKKNIHIHQQKKSQKVREIITNKYNE